MVVAEAKVKTEDAAEGDTSTAAGDRHPVGVGEVACDVVGIPPQSRNP